MTLNQVVPKKRIESIDLMRGIVMVVMALDHSRDFLTNLNYDPTDLTRASTFLFLTRFVTHYCASAFIFLAGTSAFLSISRGKTKNQAAKFLLSRGLWLIFLELTVMRFGWLMNLQYSFLFFQVIWAIGVSMVVLAALVYLPLPAIAAFGFILVFGHDMFDKLSIATFSPAAKTIWDFLHVQGMVTVGPENIFILYPLVPWIGVMALGYCFGTLYKMDDAARRKTWLRIIGYSALALFVVIRAFNLYGDPANWTDQHNFGRDILSFIDVSKYPPSLDYLLITLGPVVLLLAAFENVKNKVTDIFLVYGRVPLFYYTLHLYLLHLAAIGIFVTCGQKQGYSFPLWTVYALWITAVVILYFPCRWFMKYKQTHKQWWLSYL
jgi:uncharacterized membrane protein